MNEENICPEKPVEIQNHELKDQMKTMEPPSHSFRWDEGVSWHQHPGSAPRVEGRRTSHYSKFWGEKVPSGRNIHEYSLVHGK